MLKPAVLWGSSLTFAVIATITTAQRRFRYQHETTTRPLILQPATIDPGVSYVDLTEAKIA